MTVLCYSLVLYFDIIREADEEEEVIFNSGFGKRAWQFGESCHEDRFNTTVTYV